MESIKTSLQRGRVPEASAKQWADARRRMSPPIQQSAAEIAQELGIHGITLYKWRKTWLLQSEVVPTSERDPEGWGVAD